MKAPDFDYLRPGTLAEAIAILSEHEGEAQPLAGGQSLMPMMNFRVAAPAVLVDLSALSELRGITRTDTSVRIGAMTRYRELADWANICTDLPLIAVALPHIAHDAIRNRGTIGGSLALADAAAEMPALMLALGATIELMGPNGTRHVPADDFFQGFYDTACEADELIVAVDIPLAPEAKFGFHELVQRHGDYAMAGVAIKATSLAPLSGLRIAFFGVSDRALRVPALEAALDGTSGDEAAIAAALPALEAIEFEGDLKVSAKTRAHYAGVALKRALAEMLA
ncbi:MAG: xanthine dehydrogenase family protein subunit M [Flavimaricola sp.]|nr:xanthine dehydrogenase family protein subunit M [Flavimaricola sp.]